MRQFTEARGDVRVHQLHGSDGPTAGSLSVHTTSRNAGVELGVRVTSVRVYDGRPRLSLFSIETQGFTLRREKRR